MAKIKGKKGATPEELFQIFQMRKSGMKIKDIALLTGFDYDYVQTTLKKGEVVNEKESSIYMKPGEFEKFKREWNLATGLLLGRIRMVRYGN